MTPRFSFETELSSGTDIIDPDISLITAYVAHELTLVEMRMVDGRLTADEVFRKKVQPILDAWDHAEHLAAEFRVAPRQPQAQVASDAEIESGWRQYLADEKTSSRPEPAAANEGLLKIEILRPGRFPWRIAAATALLVGPTIAFAQARGMLYPLDSAPSETVADRVRGLFDRSTITTRQGENRRVDLSNGSSVTLSPSSRLVFRPVEGDAGRDGNGFVMSLVGEATINVSNETNTIYLGTTESRSTLSPGRYLVRAVDTDTMMSVTVTSGSLRIVPRRMKSWMTLGAGQSVRVLSSGRGASIAAAPPPDQMPHALFPSRNASDEDLLKDSSGVLAEVARSHQQSTVTIDTLKGGIVRVSNNGPNEWRGTSGWKLVLEHTIEAGNMGTDPTNQIASLVVHPDGRVVVVERNPVRITLFSPTGKTATTLARAGDGPGEVRAPVLTLRGDTLFVIDPYRRITVMTLSGKVLNQMPFSPGNTRSPMIDAQGNIRIQMPRFNGQRGPNNTQLQWIKFDRAGFAVDTIFPPDQLMMPYWEAPAPRTSWFSIPLAPEGIYRMLRNSSLVYGRTDRNEFIVTRTGRDTARVFRRTDQVPARVTSTQRDSIFADYQRMVKSTSMARGDIPSSWPLWEAIEEDGQGNIWVRHDIQPGEPRGIYDVYASSGVFRGMVAAPFVGGEWRTASWAGDRVALAAETADGSPVIKVYRIVRK